MADRDVRPFIHFLKGKKELVGVEVGAESGNNAKIMFEELDIHHMYLIDVYDTYFGMNGHGVLDSKKTGNACYNGAVNNLRNYMDKITWIIDYSEYAIEKIKEKVDFVYIDGNHRYEYVKKDIELYYPIVKIGGVFGGHDFKAEESGVIQAVTERFGNNIYQKNWDWWVIVK